MMEGPGANSEEKHEPASYIDTALVDSLKALDPEGPIREADIVRRQCASCLRQRLRTAETAARWRTTQVVRSTNRYATTAWPAS
jgi:hypothetical protein